jgi:hypothetical protein
VKRIQSGEGATDLGSTEQSNPRPSVQIYQGDKLLYDSAQGGQTWQQFLAKHQDGRSLRIEFAGTYATEADGTVKLKGQ